MVPKPAVKLVCAKATSDGSGMVKWDKLFVKCLERSIYVGDSMQYDINKYHIVYVKSVPVGKSIGIYIGSISHEDNCETSSAVVFVCS